MSDDHKAALATGRAQGRAVKSYLEAIAANRPKRGRKRTPDSVRKKIASLDEQIAAAPPLQRLQLVQQRMDLEATLTGLETTVDLSEIEDEFIAVAADYGARKGISYSAWRAVGVEPSILEKAGISRSS